MLSPHRESLDVVQQDYNYSSLEDEFIDDIKPDLISLTLSGCSNCSVNFDKKSLSTQSTTKTNCDDSPIHTRKDITSDSFLVILNSVSREDPEFSSTEILTQHSDLSPLDTSNNSSPKVNGGSKTIHSGNKIFSLPSTKDLECQQSTNLQNCQSHDNQHKSKCFATNKLSLSLHDVSRLPDFPLKYKSHGFSSDTIQSRSMTTICSGLKSKDSGLPRSISCLSLSSGGKNYEHVQSKVKEYIRQIKEADERSKSLKQNNVSNKSSPTDDIYYVCDNNESTASEKTLTTVIRDLQHELQDREIVLSKLQENYDKLLIKYAAAENRIDQLRFKVIDPSIQVTSQETSQIERHFIDSESVLKKYTDLSNKTPVMISETEPLPFLNITKSISYKGSLDNKSCSSVVQVNDSGQNLTLNPLVKPYSSSLRLDKRMEPLSQNSRSKSTDESLKLDLSPVSMILNKRYNLGKVDENSVTQANRVATGDNSNNNITKFYKDTMCHCTESSVIKEKKICDAEKPYELNHSQSEQCNKAPMPIKKQISDYVTGRKSVLCKKSLKENESKLLHDTSFEKVARWQESLPPMELIEPSCYGSLDCHSSGSKTPSQYFTKKFTSPGGHDSGCPPSELHNLSILPRPVKYSSPLSKTKTEMFEANKTSFDTDLEFIVQPITSTSCKEESHKASFSRYISADGKIYAKNSDLHQPISQIKWLDCEIHETSVRASDNLKLRSCLKENLSSSRIITPKPLNIDSCECWRLEEELSNNSKDLSISSIQYNEKPKNTFRDFYVPPLKLGSLLGGDDIDDTYDANSTYTSDVTTVSGTEGTSKDRIYFSSYEESLSLSHQATSEDVTYPSSMSLTSESPVNKLNCEMNIINNKIYPSLSNMPHMELSKRNLNHSTSESYSKCDALQMPLNYIVESRNMKYTNAQNDSLIPSATTSTSYRSIQPHDKTTEIKPISSQWHSVIKPTFSSQVNDCNKLTNIPVETEIHKLSTEHANDTIKSDISRKKLMGSTLRCLLLEFLSTLRCNNNCICNNSTQQKFCSTCIAPSKEAVDSRSLIFCSCIEDECVAAECNIPGNVNKDEFCLINNSDLSVRDGCCDIATKVLHSEEEEPRNDTKARHNHNNLSLREGYRDLAIKVVHSEEEELRNDLKACHLNNSAFDRISNVNSTVTSENHPSEKGKYYLMKYLDEMDKCARQLKARSETILDILAVQLKPSS